MNTQPQFNEADWKLFRSRLPGWQETHMDRLIREYIELLNGPESAAARFWELEKRIRRDKQNEGVVVRMSRSHMEDNIIALLSRGVICFNDLDGFSETLRERMAFLMGIDPR